MLVLKPTLLKGEENMDLTSSMIKKAFSRPPVSNNNNNNRAIIFQLLDIDCVGKNVLRLFGTTKDENSVCCYVYGFFPYFYIKNYTQCDKETLFKSNQTIKSIEECSKSNIYGYHKDGETEKYLKITTFSTFDIFTVKDQLSRECQTFESDIDYPIRFMTDAKIPGGCCWIELPPLSWSFLRKRNNNNNNDSDNIRSQIKICLFDWKNLICHNWPELAPLRILSFDIECAGRPGIFPRPDEDPVIQIGNCLKRQSCDSVENNDNNNDGGVLSVIFTLKGCAPIQGATVISFTNEAEMLQSWANFFVNVIDPDVITGYNINNFDLPYLLGRAKALNLNETFSFLGRDGKKETIVKDVLLFGRENKRINMEGRVIFDLLPIIMREHKLRSYSLNAVSFHFLNEQKEDVHHSIITDLQNGNDENRKRIAVYCLKDCLLPLKLLEKLMLLINYVEMARVAGIPLSYVVNRGQQIKVFCQILRKVSDRNLIIPDVKKKRNDKQRNKDDDEEEEMMMMNGGGGAAAAETDAVIEYEGATVIEPERGYHNTPVITLDFASLYPSIMIAHNLCYTTLLPHPPPPPPLDDEKKDYYTVSPTNDCFVKPHIRKGLLPEILQDLLASRKKAKEDMNNAKDFWEKQSFNARQYNIKVLANSIYGFTGAQRLGMLPCVQISQSVTSFGRSMIALTKEKIEELYPGSRVIYGDTDSVMIVFDNKKKGGGGGGEELSLTKAFDLGKKMARRVTETFFIDPIKLEFEKIYFPYLLINKKRYAGLYYTNPQKYDKMDCKGIETVRRDNCRLVAQVLNTCLEKILIDRNPNSAMEFVQATISRLLLDKIDISQLVITKELKKKEYKGKQPHAELAAKLRKRAEINNKTKVNNNNNNSSSNSKMAVNAPKLGERIPYVIVRGSKKSRVYENAEDPIYVLENKIPIDFEYYLNHQLYKPLVRLFHPIFGNKTENLILKGEHTRAKRITTGTIDTPGSILKFVKTRPSCIECKLPIIMITKIMTGNKSNNNNNNNNVNSSLSSVLCKKCLSQKKYIYKNQLEKLEKLTEEFDEIKQTCINCQKMEGEEKSYEDILCSNGECPIFYKRRRVELDVRMQQILAEKLSF